MSICIDWIFYFFKQFICISFRNNLWYSTNCNSNEPISNVVIKTNAGRTAISFSDGTFIIDHEEGEYILTVIADDYKPYTYIIVVQTFKTIERNIILTPETPDDNYPVIESVSTEQILNKIF